MKTLKEYFYITLGTLCVVFSLRFFMIPNNIAAGGVSGVAIVINSLVPYLGIAPLMIVMEVILYVIGFITIGNKFGAKTIYSSMLLTGVLWILEAVIPSSFVLTHDKTLAVICGVLISGTGLGIVFNQGASTGGTDIIAKILNKYTSLNIGAALRNVDLVITIGATIVFGIEAGILAILAVLFNGYVIDYVLSGFKIERQILIMSSKSDEIKKYIMNDLKRGCTILKGSGAYNNTELNIILTILGRSQFITLKKFIQVIDSRAFISVTNTHEVLGEGFE